MKKILSFTLALLMLTATLMACTENEPEDTTVSDTSSETVVESNKVTIFQKGVPSDYKMLYPYGLKGNAMSALNGLSYQIEHRYNQERFKASAEHLNMPSTPTDHEILIGDTGRDESKATKELIAEYENGYAIKFFDNGKIAIVATDDQDVLAQAIKYFTATFVVESGLENLEIEKGYLYVVDLGATKQGEWEIDVPEYEGGTLARSTYSIGANIAFNASTANGKMQIISSTTAEEFTAYLQKLSDNGYTVVARTENNNNIYVQLIKDGKTLYTYYVDYFKEVRVIDDKSSNAETDFEYYYEAKEGETTVYYQYGMMHDPAGGGSGNTSDGKWGNNGAFDIIKLADNKLILIDGGSSNQVTPETTAALMEFLHEITGTEAGEQITVAAWFLTHSHGDHFNYVYELALRYGNEVFFERIMHNVHLGSEGEMGNIATAIMTQNPDVKFLKLHTGQNVTLGNISFDVIMTHEDAVDPITGKSIILDENNTSTVLKFYMNGKTLMYFGDWGGNDQGSTEQLNEYQIMQKRLLKPYELEDGSNPTIKSDMVQIAHHGINDWMGDVYTTVAADYAFFSQADTAYSQLFYSCYKNIIKQLRAAGMEDSNMYFAGRQTNWLTIEQDGTVTHGHKAIGGAPDEYWAYLEPYEPFWPENNT